MESLAPVIDAVKEVAEVVATFKLPAVGATVSTLKATAPELAAVEDEKAPGLSIL